MADPDYDDIDVLIDTDPIELGHRCRRAERESQALCALLYDLNGRSGVDEALHDCREHMEPDAVILLDAAIARGREIESVSPS